jgi:hypothetical protein
MKLSDKIESTKKCDEIELFLKKDPKSLNYEKSIVLDKL